MATDLRPRRLHLPVIPSSKTVQQRLQQLQTEAAKLNILLRLATELEHVESQAAADERQGGGRD